MKKNILLVDDDSIITTIHRMVLEKTNLVGRIESVTNGYEAVHFLERRVRECLPLPDLVLVDLNMPLMNGFEFIKVIQSHTLIDCSAFKIIVVSSSFDPVDKEQALSLGIADYLEKPLLIPAAIHLLKD